MNELVEKVISENKQRMLADKKKKALTIICNAYKDKELPELFIKKYVQSGTGRKYADTFVILDTNCGSANMEIVYFNPEVNVTEEELDAILATAPDSCNQNTMADDIHTIKRINKFWHVVAITYICLTLVILLIYGLIKLSQNGVI